MFKYVVPTNSFGVVAAAVQGNVDCEDYISHLIVLTPLLVRAFASEALRAGSLIQ
jgi:hypothetical protein